MRRTCLSMSIVGALALPGVCIAQWVPNQGEGALSVSYQYTRITKHLFSIDVAGMVDPTTGYVGGPGNQYYLGDVFGQTANVSIDYGIWRTLALSATAAYEESKYTGLDPEGPTDDGHYHGGWQDGNVTLEYMVPWKELAITPSVGYRFPVSRYSTFGHVAIGNRLHALPLGISVGRSLSPLLPRAYMAGSFTYSFVQTLEGMNLDQRHFEGDAGYILTNAWSFGGSVSYLNTVGGLDWATSDLTGEMAWDNHDAAAKAWYVRAGAYVGYSFSREFSLRLAYDTTLDGANTHAGRSITIAPTWGFRTPFARR